MTDCVERRAIGGFHVLTLNARESRNALSPQLVQDLDEGLGAAADDPETRGLVIRGAHGVFSAGGNVGSFSERAGATSPADDPLATRNRAFGRFLERFAAFGAPTIAVVEGAAVGGGLGLACVCDFVIADAGTKFALTETTLGIVPAQIAPFVADRIGRAKTLQLALSGQRFSGVEAHALGVVDLLCHGREEMERALAKLLSDIGRCGPNAIRRFKRLMQDDAAARARSAWLDQAALCFSESMRDEGVAGVAAFREKRPSPWARAFSAEDASLLLSDEKGATP